MSCRCGLTVEEVHRIAYLTIHGWTLMGSHWEKQGFEQVVRRWNDQEERASHFDLADAYYAQLEEADGHADPG
jgi:hypothetical protein